MTNPYSELIDQMNANCIAQSTLHSVLARRHYELQRETHNVLCVLVAFAVVMTGFLLILEVRLFTVLDTISIVEKSRVPADVHPDVPRFDPALPERIFEKPTPHHYAA